MKQYLITILLIIGIGGMTCVKAQPLYPVLVFDGLSQASALDISTDGELFIVESGKNRVIKLDINGTLIDSFGGRGSGDYQFDQPNSLEATNGLKVYISDLGNRRIQMYDNRNQFLGSITSPNLSKFRFDPTFIGVDGYGNVITYLKTDHLIVRFGLMGRLDLEIGPLQDYGINRVSGFLVHKDRYFVTDPSQGLLHRFSAEGEYLNFISGYPGILALSADDEHLFLVNSNTLFIADREGKLKSKIPISESRYTAVAVLDSNLFLLTESSLTRLKLP
jgi:hypothetical protein